MATSGTPQDPKLKTNWEAAARSWELRCEKAEAENERLRKALEEWKAQERRMTSKREVELLAENVRLRAALERIGASGRDWIEKDGAGSISIAREALHPQPDEPGGDATG